jgi:protein-tyrosine phosphatase
MEYCRRLPLDGLLNARDLGGYPSKDGMTRWGVFVRADVPASLTPRDLDFLRRYGITAVVDLRSDAELRQKPDRLAGETWLRYLHIPLLDGAPAGPHKKSVPSAFEEGFFWGTQYISMAESHKAWMRAVLEALAEAQGAVLYHCTTGKDRTGLISAALLGLCGVSDEDIIADYCISQCFLGPLYEELLSYIPEGKIQSLRAPFFSTAPENMAVLLEHWRCRYGGIPGYLKDCGVSGETCARLKTKLLAEAPAQ